METDSGDKGKNARGDRARLGPRPLGILAAALLIAAAAAQDRSEFELRGRVDPPAGQASVSVWGATIPFSARGFTDASGSFRFRKLPSGSFIVTVFLPGRGEARRTVTVSPGTADEKRRVQVVIPFEGSDAAATRAAKRQSVISLKELQVSDKARKAFEDAQGKLGKDNVAGAIVDLQRAVELSPVFTDAWNNLGTIAYQGGRYPDAEKYFRQALEHEPGAYAPVVNLGGVLLNLGHPAEALKYNEYAVEQQPDDALAHSQLGMSLATLGEAERAEKHLLEAIRLDPAHFSHPQLVLARLYAGQGKRKAAAGQLEDFLKRHPDDPKTEQIRQQLEALQK